VLRLLGLLLLLSPATALAKKPALDVSLPREEAAGELRQVRRDVRDAVTRGEKPVVVFDIDDTLLFGQPGGKSDPDGAALPGAVSYVARLIDAGATIVYLTGRPTTQRAETERHLTARGFPLGKSQRLLLNPSTDWRKAVQWKEQAQSRIGKLGRVLAVFDNEKDNVRMFRRTYDRATKIFRLNTQAALPDTGRGAKGIKVITDYRTRVPRRTK
jgi:acid phosphatase class B